MGDFWAQKGRGLLSLMACSLVSPPNVACCARRTLALVRSDDTQPTPYPAHRGGFAPCVVRSQGGRPGCQAALSLLSSSRAPSSMLAALLLLPSTLYPLSSPRRIVSARKPKQFGVAGKDAHSASGRLSPQGWRSCAAVEPPAKPESPEA